MFAIGPLDGGHVRAVPMIAYKAGDQQLPTQLVTLGRRERMVEQHCVPDWFINDAIQDMREDLTLYNVGQSAFRGHM